MMDWYEEFSKVVILAPNQDKKKRKKHQKTIFSHVST